MVVLVVDMLLQPPPQPPPPSIGNGVNALVFNATLADAYRSVPRDVAMLFFFVFFSPPSRSLSRPLPLPPYFFFSLVCNCMCVLGEKRRKTNIVDKIIYGQQQRQQQREGRSRSRAAHPWLTLRVVLQPHLAVVALGKKSNISR